MNKRNWFWGIFFILAAVVVVASQVVSFVNIGVFSILATVLLATIIIRSIPHRSFGGIFVPASLIYVIFQKPFDWFYINPWLLVGAAVLLSVGLHMLIGSKHSITWFGSNNGTGNGHWVESGGESYEQSEYANRNMESQDNNDDNHPSASVRFGSMTKYLHSTNLESGNFNCSFGAMEIYLDQAVPSPNGVDLKVDCSFGGVKLYVPKSWHVQSSVSTMLAAVEDDTHFSRPTQDSPVLRLSGNVSLGAIEIAYV